MPAEEEGGQGAVGFSKVDVESPGAWVHGGEFGEAKATENTEDRTESPNGEEEGKVAGIGGDASRFYKNAGADGISHNDGDCHTKS